MINALQLSQQWITFLNNQPETGMGYWVASVILQDGRRFDRVVIIDGAITQIYGMTQIPFQDGNIASIIITHDKWKFD